ncbi:hypothetical protein AABB24_012537 [Solanum stoloniferum]|uniref:Uncharacterized protein n=1 Tax=Solanum stoloniferum TaxID=62892 RepID=A0ABD2U436_9SOLN
MQLSKLSSQGLKKIIPKELVEANNQVLEKIQEEVKTCAMLHTAEETKRKLLSEKSSLEKKIIELEKRKSSEDEHAIQHCSSRQVLLEEDYSEIIRLLEYILLMTLVINFLTSTNM